MTKYAEEYCFYAVLLSSGHRSTLMGADSASSQAALPTRPRPVPILCESLRILKGLPNTEVLWASVREVLNIAQANACELPNRRGLRCNHGKHRRRIDFRLDS